MIIVLRRYYRADIRNNPWITFVFGDNDKRVGSGGQANACRNEPNVLGIRTKKFPAMNEDAFYSDDDYFDNIAKIDEDLDAVKALLEKGNLVVFPQDGIGTGRAFLRAKAIKTYTHLNNSIRELLLEYRLPEVTEGTRVKAFNINCFKLVPLKAEKKTFEGSLKILRRRLAEAGVEDLDSVAYRSIVREMYAAMLNEIN